MGKVLFRFKLQSLSDVITNSSSELFVFKNHNMEAVKLTLDALHPNWRDEYAEPEWVRDMDDETFKDYIDWVLGSEQYDRTERNKYAWYDDRTDEEKSSMWVDKDKNLSYANYYKELAEKMNEEPAKLYTNWDVYNPYDKEWKNRYIEFSDYGLAKIKEYLAEDIALWSHDENPDWDYQEKFMEVANRYHLG